LNNYFKHAVYVETHARKNRRGLPSTYHIRTPLSPELEGENNSPTSTSGDKTYHIVMHIPGIPRNAIKVTLKDSVLKFSADIPDSTKALKPSPKLMGWGERAPSKGKVLLIFQLPRGCVNSLNKMRFHPPASVFKGVLTVSIPTTQCEEFVL